MSNLAETPERPTNTGIYTLSFGGDNNAGLTVKTSKMESKFSIIYVTKHLHSDVALFLQLCSSRAQGPPLVWCRPTRLSTFGLHTCIVHSIGLLLPVSYAFREPNRRKQRFVDTRRTVQCDEVWLLGGVFSSAPGVRP